MEGSVRLRRAWRARGLPDLAPDSLHRGLAIRVPDSPESPDTPGSPPSPQSAKSTGVPPPPPINVPQAPPALTAAPAAPFLAPIAVPVAAPAPATTAASLALQNPVLAPAAPATTLQTFTIPAAAATSSKSPDYPDTPSSSVSIKSAKSTKSATQTTFFPVASVTQAPPTPTSLEAPVANPEASESSAPPPPPPPPPTPDSTSTSFITSTTTSTSKPPDSPTRSAATSSATKTLQPVTTSKASTTALASQPASLPQSTNAVFSTVPVPELAPQQTQEPALVAGNSDGATTKAGIALGTIAGVGLLVAIAFMMYRRLKQRRDNYLNKPYVTPPPSVKDSRRPTVFGNIQARFQAWTAGGSGSGVAAGQDSSRGPPASAANNVNNQDPRTQSAILNDLFQAAYAAEDGALRSGVYNGNSMASEGYSIDEKTGGQNPGLFLPLEQVEQPGIRASIGRWLRGHHPLRLNPLGSKRSSVASNLTTATAPRFTPPSWAVPPPSVSSAGSSIRGSVGDPSMVTPRQSLTPPPPMPPLPTGSGDLGMMSRWSDSTRQTPPSPGRTSTLPPPTTPGGDIGRVSEFYDMYGRPETQATAIGMAVSGNNITGGNNGSSQWRRSSTTASTDGSWNTNSLLMSARASSNALPSVGLKTPSSSGVPSSLGTQSMLSDDSVRVTIPPRQPVPPLPGHQLAARMLEGRDIGDGGRDTWSSVPSQP